MYGVHKSEKIMHDSINLQLPNFSSEIGFIYLEAMVDPVQLPLFKYFRE